MNETTNENFFLNTKVEKERIKAPKLRDEALKIRLKTLIAARGMSQADFYKSLGLGKDYWYLISWGKIVPALDIKVRISQALGVDSSVIWQAKQEVDHGKES